LDGTLVRFIRVSLLCIDMTLCVSTPEVVFDCDHPDCDCEVAMTPEEAGIARDFADGVICDCH